MSQQETFVQEGGTRLSRDCKLVCLGGAGGGTNSLATDVLVMRLTPHKVVNLDLINGRRFGKKHKICQEDYNMKEFQI